MTAGWVLPRDWDAGRLLRFITGLALLALAFAVNAGLVATPFDTPPSAPVTGVTTTVDLPAAVPADQAPEQAPVPAPEPVVTVSVTGIHISVIEPVAAGPAPAGVVPGAHGSRAPPVV